MSSQAQQEYPRSDVKAKGWKVAISDRVLETVHGRYSSAILAAQVLRGMGSRKVKVVRA